MASISTKESIKTYIKNTFQNKRVYFDKKYINQNIDNDLIFIDLSFNKVKIYFKYEPFSIYLMNMFTEKYLTIVYQKDDNDQYYFETRGLIPVRYLSMIKDFYWKDIKIENCDVNFDSIFDLIDNTPLLILKNIIDHKKILTYKEHVQLQVLDENWKTDNCKFNDYTKDILHKSSNYISLKYNNKTGYRPFAAAEGGIHIYNDYSPIIQNFSYANDLRFFNYAKGSKNYTNKHNSLEEMYFLYLFLKDNDIDVKITIKF
tara:strand:- start:362 stop:1138 length:777 start_codon:yes stop_codon:yes gene_type:complete